jgi:hypothetical protein
MNSSRILGAAVILNVVVWPALGYRITYFDKDLFLLLCICLLSTAPHLASAYETALNWIHIWRYSFGSAFPD